MIQPTELRIGNKLTFHGKEITVQGILEDWVYDGVDKCPCNAMGLHPIPLTAEWLFRFGFVQTLGNEFEFKRKDCWIYLLADCFEIELIAMDERFNFCRPYKKEVHVFQNIMFSVLGAEEAVK